MSTIPIRGALYLVLLTTAPLRAQAATSVGKFGFFGTASVAFSTPITLTRPAGSPFGVPEPRYEIGKSDLGIGGGILVGLAVNRFGFFGTMDILKSGIDHRQASKHFGGAEFMADLGVRYDVPFVTSAVNPYVIGSFGYYDLSYKTGDPTIITGPGGGYDSGTTTYDGSMLSFGVGIELARRLIANGQAARRMDLRLVSSRVGFAGDYPPESVQTLRLFAGMTWWVRSGL